VTVERLERDKTFDTEDRSHGRLARIFQGPAVQSFAKSEDPTKESATSH
jgi:hypothetical protein